MHFLVGNTVIILSSYQLKVRILRFVVHSVLAVHFKGVISNQITFSRLKPQMFCTPSDAPAQMYTET